MSLDYSVLGRPGSDNAVFLKINAGQSICRLLFDCGEGCLQQVPLAERQLIDHVFFSHFHMDHVAGFDTLVRCTYNRVGMPMHIWGPPGSTAIVHHRLQGYFWNLYQGQSSTWFVHELDGPIITSSRLELAEAFSQAHPEGRRESSGTFLMDERFSVEAVRLNHLGPCLGYIVHEAPHLNVNADALTAKGLPPGPWLQALKDATQPDDATVTVGERVLVLGEMRKELLQVREGESFAYLTDFLMDESTRAELRRKLSGVGTVICESQYAGADLELALRNHHLTVEQAAHLANEAGIGTLVLFHLSDRYTEEEWQAMLLDARQIFPSAMYAREWSISSSPPAADRESIN